MKKKKEIKSLKLELDAARYNLSVAYQDIESLIKAYPDDLNCLDARCRYRNRYSMEKFLLLGKSINVVDDKKPLVYPDSEGIYDHLASKEIKFHKVPETTTSTIPENEARIQRQTINDRQMLYGSPEGTFKGEFETSGQGFRTAIVTDKEKDPIVSIDSLKREKEVLINCYHNLYSLGATILCKLRDDPKLDYFDLSTIWDSNREKIDQEFKSILKENPEPKRFNRNDVIEVAEKLYYIANPDTKMDVPSSFYETVEGWYSQWEKEATSFSFYDWCLRTKHKSNPNQ